MTASGWVTTRALPVWLFQHCGRTHHTLLADLSLLVWLFQHCGPTRHTLLAGISSPGLHTVSTHLTQTALGKNSPKSPLSLWHA